MCRTACWPSVGLLVEFTRFEVIQVLSPVFPANCKLIDSNPRHRKLPEARDRCHSRQVHRSGHGSGVVHGRPILHEGCGVLRQRGRPWVRSLFSSFESKSRLRIKTHKILSNVLSNVPFLCVPPTDWRRTSAVCRVYRRSSATSRLCVRWSSRRRRSTVPRRRRWV